VGTLLDFRFRKDGVLRQMYQFENNLEHRLLYIAGFTSHYNDETPKDYVAKEFFINDSLDRVYNGSYEFSTNLAGNSVVTDMRSSVPVRVGDSDNSENETVISIFDELNRLISIETYDSDNPSFVMDSTTFEYLGNSDVVSCHTVFMPQNGIHDGIEEKYTYHPAGHLLSFSRSVGPNFPFEEVYSEQYYPNGNVLSIRETEWDYCDIDETDLRRIHFVNSRSFNQEEELISTSETVYVYANLCETWCRTTTTVYEDCRDTEVVCACFDGTFIMETECE